MKLHNWKNPFVRQAVGHMSQFYNTQHRTDPVVLSMSNHAFIKGFIWDLFEDVFGLG